MAQSGRRTAGLASACCAALVIGLVAWLPAADESEPTDSTIFASDRAAVQRLTKARRLLADEHYAEAARLLGAILEGPQDCFFQPNREEPVHRSLKNEAQRVLAQMPRAGREAYELLYGAQAQQLLQEAVSKGDAAAVAGVARQFFHTRAGAEATYLLGIDHLDHGRPLAAALCLRRLTESPDGANRLEPQLSLALATSWARAGMAAEAKSAIQRLAARYAGVNVTLAGKDVQLAADAPAITEWLSSITPVSGSQVAAQSDQWTIYRGDPARNGTSHGGAPLLTTHWRVVTSDDPAVEKLILQLRDAYGDLNVCAIPAMNPLAVGDTVLMRTIQNLSAIDFSTGKRLWEVPTSGDMPSGLNMDAYGARESAQFTLGIEQRIWDDLAFGSITSDGQRVFSIEDLNIGISAVAMPNVIGGAGRRRAAMVPPKHFNRVAAHDIRTGKLLWELGGPKGDLELPQAGTFFLGAPLPVAGLLYVLAESEGEIRLMALDAATGESQWSQQLAVIEESVLQDRLRRLAGASPSYADGVLVCPTVAGAVVAVDLTTRSLLWGYRYPEAPDSNPRRMIAIGNRGGAGLVGRLVFTGDSERSEQWTESTATIAGGRVLLTPIEGESLHCLDLFDGNVIWSVERGDDLFVAGVYDGLILMVGHDAVRALKLEDGQPAWKEPVLKLPDGGMPSGRGFYTDGRYYLPLSTAEVVAIDVAHGKVWERYPSRRRIVPGNLVCHRGVILSQQADALDAFYELAELEKQIASKLAQNPNDATALSLRGQLALESDHLADAIDDLRKAYQLEPAPATRLLLLEGLLDGLKSDFATYQRIAPEIESLLEGDDQRARYLQLMAAGLESQKGRLAAFEVYLQFADLQFSGKSLEPIDEVLSVRRDRWVQAQLAQLVTEASDAEREQINQVLQKRVQDVLASNQPDQLSKFLRYFGTLSVADEVRQRLVSQLTQPEDQLEREFVLERLERSEQPAIAGQACLLHARMLLESADPRDAERSIAQLADRWAETALVDNKTGKVWAEEMRVPSTFANLGQSRQWPYGEVDKRRMAGTNAGRSRVGLLVSSSLEPFLSDLTFEWEQARPGQPLVAIDASGREAWQVPLIDLAARVGSEYTPGYNCVTAQGHLLIVSMGRRVYALDMLNQAPDEAPRIVWSREAIEPIPGSSPNQMLQSRPVTLDWGPTRYETTDGFGRSIGSLGPATNDYLCIPNHRGLTALDIRTGEPLWHRQDISQGSHCFGDEEFVFAVPRDGEAVVLRALDGQRVGERAVPPADQRMATLGRLVLCWKPVGGERRLSLVDAYTGNEQWQRTFAAGSKAELIGLEQVGVVEPQGRFMLLNLPDGRVLIDSPIEAERDLSEIYLLKSMGRFILVTNRSWQTDDMVWLRPIPGGLDNRLVNGHVYGFDQGSGDKLWSQTVERQAILLRQPSDLPMLIFVCHIYERPANGQPQNRNHVAVLCLDKRDGRILHQEQLAAPLPTFSVTADLDQHQIDLHLMRETIRMTFTDRPIMPDKQDVPAPPDKEEARPADKDEPPVGALPPLPRHVFVGAGP